MFAEYRKTYVQQDEKEKCFTMPIIKVECDIYSRKTISFYVFFSILNHCFLDAADRHVTFEKKHQ